MNGMATIVGATREPAASMVLGVTDVKRSPKLSKPICMSANESQRG
jgi:hypothetical protein